MEFLHLAIENLARGRTSDLATFFHAVETNVLIDDTSASCHIHCVNLDGNGRPRVNDLVTHLIENIVDYAIPRKRIIEASHHLEKTGSSQKHVALYLEASGLFTRLSQSGEGGELILFLMAERFLKLPQLICKMNLKTSSQMHYHGADGLHVGVDPVKGKLCLYWGESKLYSNVTDAIRECMSSIAPMLLDDGGLGSPGKRDLQLLGQYLNIDDGKLDDALKNFLDPDSQKFNSVEYRGLCLVGFDSKHYPNKPNIATINQVKATLAEEVSKWQTAVGKRIKKEAIESFSIHVFLMPFPSVDEFRKTFKAALTPKHVTQ